MRPRWRKIIADLWGNIARFILVTLSLAVGMFAVGMIAGGYVMTLENMENGYKAINPANIRIGTSGFDQNLVERVLRLDGVTEAQGEKKIFAQMRTGEGEWQDLVIQVLPEEEQTIDRISLLDGWWPGDEEMMLSVHRDADLDVGEVVEIQLITGTERELKITGMVRDQTIGVAGASFFVAPAQGYVTYSTQSWLQENLDYKTLLVTVERGTDSIRLNGVADEITNIVEQSGRQVDSLITTAQTTHPNSGYVSAAVGLLVLLGFLSVFLSSFLVFNAMSSLFAQQIKYIGIMKAIGAQKKAIVKMYMVFIFIIGVLALLIAIPSAAWAATELGKFLAVRLNYLPGEMTFEPLAVILQIAIALIVPQITGIIPILKVSQVSVQEAIMKTGIETDDFGKGWIDRRLEKLKGLTRPLLISLRNTFRRKGRLALTLITLSLGGAVFIATFNVRASLETYIDQVAKYVLSDVAVDFTRPYRIDEIESVLKSIEGVAKVEPRGSASAQLLNDIGDILENVAMFSVLPDSELTQPIVLKGRWIIPGDDNAIVLNEAFLTHYPAIDVGDKITLSINRREVEWEVVGFFQFIGSDYYLAYVPIEYLNQVIGNVNKAPNFQVLATQDISANGSKADLALQLDEILRERGYKVRNTSSSEEVRGNATLGLDTLTTFLLIMSGLTALVGIISLTGTMGMNVMERTREIGVMRAIGATDRQIKGLVIVEGVIIGLISWLFGTLLAFPISAIMSNILNTSIFGMPGEFTFTAIGFIVWIVVVILLSVFASIVPANKAAHLTIREVLAYE
jgi:putative ABC transport system permease protein